MMLLQLPGLCYKTILRIQYGTMLATHILCSSWIQRGITGNVICMGVGEQNHANSFPLVDFVGFPGRDSYILESRTLLELEVLPEKLFRFPHHLVRADL